MDAKEQARKVQELVDTGMSLEEALTVVLKEVKVYAPITDRVAWISGLETVEEVRRAIKVARAKKSKSVKLEKKDKYQLEIDAGNARLNSLLAEVYDSGDPIRGLLDMGEDPTKVLHNWIRAKEEELKAGLKAYQERHKVSKNKLKVLVADQNPTTPKVVAEELKGYHPDLVKVYEERVGRLDQGVIAINRKVRLLNK